MVGQSDEKQVLTLAPDAMVFINGKDTVKICPDCDCGFKLKDVITSISVDLSIDSSPGSASLQMSNPQHVLAPMLNEKRQALHAMQEVEIYMKSRFTKKGQHSYYPVFWGFVSTISDNYSDGTYNVTVNCKDILRWWEISKVNVSPAVIANVTISAQNPTMYSKTYSNQPIATIIRDLAQITMAELVPIDNINALTKNTEQRNVDQIKDFFVSNFKLLEYWKERFDQVGRSLKIYGYNGETIDNKSNIDTKDAIMRVTQDKDDLSKIDNNKNSVKQLPENEGQGMSFIGIDGPDVTKIMPDNIALGGLNLFESGFESKLEIANSMKEVVKWEFFMDTNGELIFKPSFYNMDVRGNVIQEIEDTDIIDWGFTEDESPIITRADVSGQYTWYSEVDKHIAPFGMYIDYLKSLQFGMRVQTFAVPYLRTSQQCQVYAQSEVNRINSLLKTGTITIVGRPELRLGYPIYIHSKDAYYYVTGIAHNFAFGSTYTTQLTLTGERKKFYDEYGIVRKHLAMVLQDADTYDFDSVKEYMNQRVSLAPNISYDLLLSKVKTQFPDIENSSLMSKVEQQAYYSYYVYSDTQSTPNTVNTFDRIYDPCANEPIKKVRAQTIDYTDHSGNQGKVPVFVDKFIESVDYDNLNSEFQITDEHGYFLIGIFPYGRKNKLLPTSSIASRSLDDLQSTLNLSRLEGFAFMQPDSTKSNQEIDKDNVTNTLDNVQQLMLTLADRENRAAQAYRVRALIEKDVCNCGCHKRSDQ